MSGAGAGAATGGRPAGNGRPAGSRTGGARRATAGRAAGTRGAGGSSAGILRFYTDDAPGIKVGPTTVLTVSLSFIGLVVLLHIWGKFRS
mmetsp:Transcript_12981/g.28650  ORF Transcript_12981/g.28650 Transcript_12981/m.28650 type:complete len:90 (+) Transcript_12981:309-578(+)